MLSSQVCAQQQVDGIVIDRDTGKPVPFASLVILGTSNGTSTNLNGQFSLILADTFSIKVTCVGYESALIRSVEEAQVIKIKAIATHLDAVLVYNKAINPNKIVRKAFASVSDNYDTKSFLQKFFYRHYSKTDSAYERLTEAAVDIWKHDGYRTTRKYAGEKEEMRINQLRRSLDIKGMVQAQKPLHLSYILQADIVGYQNGMTGAGLNAMEEVSNMKADILNYSFTFNGTTNYDGQEVYKIDYARKADSVLTTSGYRVFPETSGSLFIATDNYAFVKTEGVKRDEFNTIRSTAYYRKYGTKYYPYHLIREGESHFQGVRSFHVELMSQEIRHGEHEQFKGSEPGRKALLQIPYDSGFWSSTSILKTTPLEDDIIRNLGAGISLNKQFYLYRLYEQNVTDGGK
ncbi:MAG TPA: carboxypeptidase-like regulatory domain-containing protein, partial [Cyclobacteriaceae bacterium]